MAVTEKQFELLAPGGDLESIKAAIAAGADAVYCGLDRFNARNRATNISLDMLDGITELAHRHDCEVFITLNVLILESEIPAVVRLLEQLVDTDIDGVIVQDLGLAYLLKHYFPTLDVHASTQANTHNTGQFQFLKQLGASRVNLSRELSLEEIGELAHFGRQHDMLTEVFVHGSYCVSFSGLCYASSVRNGASGNRGRCSQPCRDQFETTAAGYDFPLNMKDNTAFDDMAALADAGVYSLKVEGRVKKPHYVFSVVDQWRQQIDRYLDNAPLSEDKSTLYTVFNRDFSNGYLHGTIGDAMFIDNPRDHAAQHRAAKQGVDTADEFKAIKRILYREKTAIINSVEQKTRALDVSTGTTRSLKGQQQQVKLPTLSGSQCATTAPSAAILISQPQQIEEFAGTTSPLYYQLPDSLAHQYDVLLALFTNNPQLIPWFGPVLIGKDFQAAQQLLETLKPSRIVTDNSGVAWAAHQLGIDWLAGPQMNTTNSWTLHCLKTEFGCVGAFVSTELNKRQLKSLVCPNDFELHYCLYQPVTLMTSRQCLLQRTLGCRKPLVKKGCTPKCDKQVTVKSRNDEPWLVDKSSGFMSRVYAHRHHFNPDVISALPGRFSHYLLDMRPIDTSTTLAVSQAQFCQHMESFIATAEGGVTALAENTMNKSWHKGL